MESPAQSLDSDGILEIDTLKQFTIPKRKKAKRELFETIASDSREYVQDILQVLKLSYKDRESARNFSYSRPRLIHNDQLLDEYAEKKKQMRQDGYTEKELQDVYGFLYVETEQEMRRICRDGLHTGNCKISCLGNPKMGVYLSKHADIITAEPLKSRQSGMILIMKIIKGKVKFMVENRSGTPLEPSPNFDCHLLKTLSIDMSAASPQYVYECTQLYLYEYKDDAELSDRPRQVYPFAVVDFRFQGILSRDASRLGPPILQQQMKSQVASTKSGKKQPWSGKDDSSLPPHLEPPEPKKPKQKSGDSMGSSKKPPPLSLKADPSSKSDGSAADKDGSQGGCLLASMHNAVLWSGELICGGVTVSNVQLLSFSLAFKPSGLRQSINVENKVSLAYILRNHLHCLKSFDDHRADCQVEGVSYFYACLVPISSNDRAFKKFVDYLVLSEAGVVVNLRNDTEMVIFPDSCASRHLGLTKEDSSFTGLHCVFIMKKSKAEYLLDEVERRLQLPEDLESKTAEPPDATASASAEDKSAESAASTAECLGADASADSGQTSDSSQCRDPRLRRKPSQTKAVKPTDAARSRPAVVSHSRLVMMFDEMSKLQDKSNIEFARMMMMMNRHGGGASNSHPSPGELAHPPSVLARTETSDAYPPRRLGSHSSTARPSVPSSQHPACPPLLCPPDKEGPRGPRHQVQPWGRRWPSGDGPQPVIPNRQNPFPAQSPGDAFGGGWNQQFKGPLFPPGPEFSAGSNRQREMLSPRAWEELRKKGHGRDAGPGQGRDVDPGHGRDAGQRLPESQQSISPADHTGQPLHWNSDARISGHQGNYMNLDVGQYPNDQQYIDQARDYSEQDPGIMRPVDPQSSGEIYGSYDTNRWMGDPRSGLHQGHDFSRWPVDPRQGHFGGEYQGQDPDWWATGQRVPMDWPNQNVGLPASENVRPGLLGDYPVPNMTLTHHHHHHPMKPRPSDSTGELLGRGAVRPADPRISRWPADPRANQPPNSKVVEANANSDNNKRDRSVHSSAATALDNVDKLEQS